jgi:hypothetical protein
VKKDGDASREGVGRAFAICTKQLQRTGHLKSGTREPTKKGASRGRSKAAEKGHSDKVIDYEKILQIARSANEQMDDNDVDIHGMDANTRKRLKIKGKGKVKKRKPLPPKNTKMPYGLRRTE